MQNRRSLILRWTGEFLVIVLGVLVALAADRWNESRSDAALEREFMTRLVDEIRNDSILASEYVTRTRAIVTARDTLLNYVAGGPPPDAMIPTIVTAFGAFSLPAPVAWSELGRTASLSLVGDPAVRQALSRYYTIDRVFVENRLDAAGDTGMDPFYDALYEIGWGVLDVEGRTEDLDSASFRRWPGMRGLLIGIGSSHAVRTEFARQLTEMAGATLAEIETSGRPAVE